MKKFKQLVMAFLVGVVSFGFTACSDENNEEKFELPEVGQATVNVSSSDKEMQKVAKVYVTRLFIPHIRHSPQTHAHSTPQQPLSTPQPSQAP